MVLLLSGYPVNRDVVDAEAAAREMQEMLAAARAEGDGPGFVSGLAESVPDGLPALSLRFLEDRIMDDGTMPGKAVLYENGVPTAAKLAKIAKGRDGEGNAVFVLALSQITRKGRVKPDDANLLGMGEVADWILSARAGGAPRTVGLYLNGEFAGVFGIAPAGGPDSADED